MELPPDVTRLLDRQEGVATRRDLVGLGLSPSRVDGWLRWGALERVGHGVYRRTGSGVGARQEEHIALLRCGAGARLSGARILGYLGVEGFASSDPFVVLLPPGRRTRIRDLPVRTDVAPGMHRARYGSVPGTGPARALVELADGRARDGDRWPSVPDGELLSIFDRARWRGLVTGPKLAVVIDELGRHPGACRLRRLLGTTAAQLESPGERRLERALDGLHPPLEWQVWVAPDLRVDALWRDLALVVEYDGAATHDHPRDRATDAARHARLRALGYEVIVVDRHDLRHPAALRSRLLAVREQRRRSLEDLEHRRP